ncbi:MAG: hypothetical protein U5K54_18235 [Cytophagales bacterium]|nr:hypothetical protein [Cytophagales bacterium]
MKLRPVQLFAEYPKRFSCSARKFRARSERLLQTTTASGGGVGTLPINTAFGGFNNTVADNYIVWASYLRNTGATSGACEEYQGY